MDLVQGLIQLLHALSTLTWTGLASLGLVMWFLLQIIKKLWR